MFQVGARSKKKSHDTAKEPDAPEDQEEPREEADEPDTEQQGPKLCWRHFFDRSQLRQDFDANAEPNSVHSWIRLI